MPEDFSRRIGFDDFNFPEIGMTPSDAETESFSSAVTDYFTNQFASMGGSARVIVNDQTREILVDWSGKPSDPDSGDAVMELLRTGQLERAVQLLWMLIQKDPRNVDHHYNIGLAYNQLREFDKAAIDLSQAVKLAPHHVNAVVALGLALLNTEAFEEASNTLLAAVTRNHPGRLFGTLVGKLSAFDVSSQCSFLLMSPMTISVLLL